MTLVVVTSCSIDGWGKYGQKFLTSFDQFWPQETNLHIVSEDRLPIPQSILNKRPQIKFWDLNQNPFAASFAGKYENDPVANGFRSGCPISGWRSKKTGYDFRKDAFRFSKKVFSINLVAPTVDDESRFIWLDADTITLKPVPVGLFTEMPPKNFCIAYLDRYPYHSECGFVSYNLAKSATRSFLREFSRLYSSGEVFKLPEWHDSYVFDWLRRKLDIPSFPISYDRRHITHPFVYSILGQYMDHLKGMRKQRGVSHDHPRFHVHSSENRRRRKERIPPARYPRHQQRMR